MPYQALALKPGINVEESPLLNSTGWATGAAIRFRDGLAEKVGGFSHLNPQTITGICTGMHSWADLAGNLYIATGTDQLLQIFIGGLLYDITPLRLTTNANPSFTTIAASKVVNITDTLNGASVGDWVMVFVPVSIGGIVLQGLYLIKTIVDANNYTILSANAAVSSVSNAGAVPTYTSTSSSANVLVTLANHGLIVGSLFTVHVSTTVGGITISPGTYPVTAPVTTNTFTIAPGAAAGSTATVAENSGHAQLQYLIASGLQSATFEATGGGFGVGIYGGGIYGASTQGTILVPLRQSFWDNFGQDLVGNFTGSPIYVWTPPVGNNNRALAINTTNFPSAIDPPKQANFSFLAGPQEMIIAGGCNTPGTSTYDPNLLRWCDSGNFLDWVASSTNLAGSYRIPSGSKLVGGISAPNFTVIWTDIDMWLMSYLGAAGALAGLVWGFDKVAGAAGLLSARSCAVFRNLVFYLSSNGMYVFDGNRITLVPCPVWDKFWKNLNRQQVDKVNLSVNSYFQEISINFPSSSGDGTVDSRLTYNIRENIWAFDDAPTTLARTAWIDENVYGAPAGTDLAGYIQQQDSEGVYDADGSVLNASIQTGWFSVQEGSLVSMMERLEMDAIVAGGTGTIYVTVLAKDYPTDSAQYPVRTYGPYAWNVTSGPPWFITRARGRFFSLIFSSQDLGVFWRLGKVRYLMGGAGRRP